MATTTQLRTGAQTILPADGPLRGAPAEETRLVAELVAGAGSLRNLYRAGTIPGTYAADLRTGGDVVQADRRDVPVRP